MKGKLLLGFVILVLLSACKESNQDSPEGSIPLPSSPSAGSPNDENSSVVEKSKYSYNDDLGICLNKSDDPGYNSSPDGKDAECVDFSNQDLTGRDFSGNNLTGANFSGAILNGVILSGARLKGIKIEGIEVDSEHLLKWLVTGSEPAPPPSIETSEETPPPAPQEEDITEELTPEVEPTIIVDEPMDPIEEIPETNVQELKLEDFKSAEDLVSYYQQVKANLQPELMYSQLKFVTDRLDKYLLQSVYRVRYQEEKVLREQISIAKTNGELELLAQKQFELQGVQSHRSEIRTDILAASEVVKASSLDYKEDRDINSRATRIELYASRLVKLGYVFDTETEFNKDYQAIIENLESQSSLLQPEIDQLKVQASDLKQTIQGIRDTLIPYKESYSALTQEIKDFNVQIAAIKEAISIETDAVKKQALIDQRNQLIADRAPVIEKRKLVYEDIKQINGTLVDPQAQLKEINITLGAKNTEKRELQKSIQENKLLLKLQALNT